MKNTCLLFFAALLTISAVAQDKVVNDANAQKRTVPTFHAISVSGGVDLFLTQSTSEAVAVSANKLEDRDRIKTEVVDGVLKIYYDAPMGFTFSFTSRKLKAYVSVKNIDELRASGGSDVDVNGTLAVSTLKMGISGGSDFKGKVDVTELDIHQSGGSDVDISGRAVNVKIGASGGSDFNGYELTTDKCFAHCSGGSDITVTVNKELSADASGGSDIHYRGTGTVTKAGSSGGGSIKKRG
jgi:hypothetical protein